jgi:hypothetical protein
MRSPLLLLPQLHDTEVAVARCDVVGNATDGKKHPRRRGGSPVHSCARVASATRGTGGIGMHAQCRDMCRDDLTPVQYVLIENGRCSSVQSPITTWSSDNGDAPTRRQTPTLPHPQIPRRLPHPISTAIWITIDGPES